MKWERDRKREREKILEIQEERMWKFKDQREMEIRGLEKGRRR